MIEKAPKVPDFDGLADEALNALEKLTKRLAEAFARMQPVGEILAEIDLLVAQTDFASRIAGAVALWHEPGGELYTLDLLTPPRDAKPRVRFPWLEDATRWLIERNAYTPREVEAVAVEAEAKSKQRWQSVKQLETMRAEIVTSFRSGESFETFRLRVRELVTATKPQLETAFRTATHQAYVVGQTITLEKPIVKTLFPSVEYMATMDTRVRDTHRVLDGRVFEVGTDAYLIAKRALADFNCRCALRPLSRKQAERMPAPENVGSLPVEVLADYG